MAAYSASPRLEIEAGDPSYPACVAELPDAPKTLYVLGDPSVLEGPSLSVIGSRRATPYGLATAEMAGKVAADSGVTVVSGGAVGCDQAAGRAALDSGGTHIIVLGSGADVPYPRSAVSLIERTLASGGAVVSIEPWGAPPRRWAFPRRNRIIAALSAAVLVTEAGMPSGTFGTAEAAAELGREVLAVPGSILSPQSRGSNYLIASGACCIADVEALEVAISRIYGRLRFCRGKAPGLKAPDAAARGILQALIADPMRPEEIAAACRLDGIACLRALSALEVAGAVERLVDGRFSLSRRSLHALAPLGQNE